MAAGSVLFWWKENADFIPGRKVVTELSILEPEKFSEHTNKYVVITDACDVANGVVGD